MERVSLTTADNLKIAADVFPSRGELFAILLHMMPATKESWRPLAEKLVAAGYTCIAIDERGHGESEGGPSGFKEMSDAEQRAKIHDVRAAFAFLQTKGATLEKTSVIGASIGANLSIVFLQAHPEMKKAVALSPGIDYRGVTTEAPVRGLAPGQTVLLLASDEDATSARSAQLLHAANASQTTLRIESGLGHGTTMLENKPELMAEIILWLQGT